MAATPPRRDSSTLSPRLTSTSFSFDNKQERDRTRDDIVELKKGLGIHAAETSGAWAAVPPVLSYCGASILMTLVNKFVVSGAHFSMNFLLLTMQSVVCIFCVTISKRMGFISFRDFDLEDAKKWFPISFLLAYGEVIWFGGAVTRLTLGSFILMVISSLIAAWADISHTVTSLSLSAVWADPAGAAAQLPAVSTVVGNLNAGYMWMIINCCVTAAYVLTMRKRIKSTGFKDWDSMFYNNLLSIPVLALFSFLVEDWGYENLNRNFPIESRNLLLSAIAFSGAAAVFISYTTAWCVRTTSSTTYSMVGALNKLPVAASGMIFFGDPTTVGSVSAVGLGFFAGVVYAVAKNNQSKADKARAGPSSVIPLHRKP
ncbi:GDP-mannose transporter into the lumen of the Golgi [Tulasnella sp. 330]|nr:GDP-mannose transporter into the lumen of the Golgi [Tulasnella sp. 330]